MNTEQLAEKLHEWYLEACKELNPESYNAKAQKSYADLTEEQKFLDRYIAGKAYSFIRKNDIESLSKDVRSKLLLRMMKYDSKDGYSTLHDEILEKVSNDVDDILSEELKNLD